MHSQVYGRVQVVTRRFADRYQDKIPPGGTVVADDAPLTAGELSRVAAQVLTAIPFPALVLEIPSERIVASSPSASLLVHPGGGDVVGHLLEEFTADRPVPGIDLFAGGKLNGFETFRVLRRPSGGDVKVRMWIRSFDRQPSSRFVVVVLVADHPLDVGVDGPGWQDAPAVVGTANAQLFIEGISSEAEDLFHRPVADLVGAALTDLIQPADTATLMAGLAEASASQNGITQYLNIQSGVTDSTIRCEVLILPLLPSPSCTFVFLPTAGSVDGAHVSDDLSVMLVRLGRNARIAQLTRGVFRGISEASMPGLNRLTNRELDVLNRLLDGDRPPAIANTLVLSQSTIRNHLASIFTKLAVTSQQELLNKIRGAQSEGRE